MARRTQQSGVLLDQGTDHLERGAFADNAAELLLAFLAPMTFGLLVWVTLALVFYCLLPRWLPFLKRT